MRFTTCDVIIMLALFWSRHLDLFFFVFQSWRLIETDEWMDNLILTPVTENFMLIFISFKRILATLCQMKLKNFYYNLGLIFLSSIKHLLPAFLSVFNSLTVIVSLFFYNIRCLRNSKRWNKWKTNETFELLFRIYYKDAWIQYIHKRAVLEVYYKVSSTSTNFFGSWNRDKTILLIWNLKKVLTKLKLV